MHYVATATPCLLDETLPQCVWQELCSSTGWSACGSMWLWSWNACTRLAHLNIAHGSCPPRPPTRRPQQGPAPQLSTVAETCFVPGRCVHRKIRRAPAENTRGTRQQLQDAAGRLPPPLVAHEPLEAPRVPQNHPEHSAQGVQGVAQNAGGLTIRGSRQSALQVRGPHKALQAHRRVTHCTLHLDHRRALRAL